MRINVRFDFLDGSYMTVVGQGLMLSEGMVVIDHGQGEGETAVNIRALKSWKSEIQ